MSRFRTIRPDGAEEHLDDVDAVVEALRQGALRSESLLFDSHTGRWLPAGQHDAVQAASAAFRQAPATSAASLDAPSPRTYTPQAEQSSAPLPSPGATDDTLDRLRAYIRPNWQSHYEKSFRRLLTAQRHGSSPGWTWNWPAALVPVWFLYRRLYAAFFAFLALYVVIDVTDKAAAGSQDGGSAVAILFLGQVVLMGFLGDRLLFRKALAIINREPGATNSQLAAFGGPNRWAAWVPVSVIAIGILAAILIPMLAGK